MSTICFTGGVASVLEPTTCEHYDADCEKDNVGSTDRCSPVVKVCDGPELPGKRNHCFALWRNVSGSLEVIKKGCWIDYEICYDHRECIGFATEKIPDGYFCCCDVSECNRNMSWSSVSRHTTLRPALSKYKSSD